MDFLILPTQLFNKKYLDKENNYFIYEHPQYFTKYKFNKKKLVLHRASMKYYFDYLKDNNFKVKYIEYDKKPNLKEYKLFDPIDKINLIGKSEVLDSPNFLLTKELIEKHRMKTKKFFFNSFYMWSKKELNILPGIKSQDKYNRKTMPKNTKIPNILGNKKDQKYIKEAVKYIEKNFPKNYGNTNNFIYPISHSTVNSWLNNFFKNKLNKFGDYQDYINKDNSFMFHSILSSSINIGLINPSEIIDKILKLKGIKLNNLEGYIRQLFWREYQRYCYIYYNFENKNYFSNNKKLNKDWYEGTTGILPIDNCIKNGFETGYLHHIERLMVMGNFMNLYGLHPKEGFKWFMEFSCDSYEWVMNQNVYDMVFFVSGGATMRRPYVSSSNYVLKMSNYKKADWCDEWDDLYYKFLKKNKKKLWKFRYYFRGLKDI